MRDRLVYWCLVCAALLALAPGGSAQSGKRKSSGSRGKQPAVQTKPKPPAPPADPFDLTVPYSTVDAIKLDPEKDLPVSSWLQPKIAKASASYFRPENPPSAMCDGREPTSPVDSPCCGWWPHFGTREWVQYDFANDCEVDRAAIWWYAEASGTGCSLAPQAWRLYWLDGAVWRPVQRAAAFATSRGAWNVVLFAPVKTRSLRAVIMSPPGVHAAISQWRVGLSPAGVPAYLRTILLKDAPHQDLLLRAVALSDLLSRPPAVVERRHPCASPLRMDAMNLAWVALSGRKTPEQLVADLQSFAKGWKRTPDFELAAECIARGVAPERAMAAWDAVARTPGTGRALKHYTSYRTAIIRPIVLAAMSIAKDNEDATVAAARAEAMYDRYLRPGVAEEVAALLAQAEGVSGKRPEDVLRVWVGLQETIPWRQLAKEEWSARLAVGVLVSGVPLEEAARDFRAVGAETRMRPGWTWWDIAAFDGTAVMLLNAAYRAPPAPATTTATVSPASGPLLNLDWGDTAAAKARGDGKVDRYVHNGHNVQVIGPRIPEVDAYVTREMAEKHRRNVAFAVVHKDRLVWVGYYSDPLAGTCDVGRDWEWGSISKPLGSQVLLDSVDEGELSLEDPILRVLGNIQPAWPDDGQPHVMDPRWARVKVRDCMNHGFSLDLGSKDGDDVWAIEYQGRHRGIEKTIGKPYASWTHEDLLRAMLTFPLKEEPGRTARYMACGGVVIANLLERLGGNRADKVMERFFKDECLVEGPYCIGYPEVRFAKLPQLRSYARNPSDGTMFVRHIGDDVCAGSWCGSVEDLVRIGAAINRGDVFGNPRKMFPIMLDTRDGWSCGWSRVHDPDGKLSLGKNGCADGFQSNLGMGWGNCVFAVVSDCGDGLPDISQILFRLDRSGFFDRQPDQWRNVPGARYEPFR